MAKPQVKVRSYRWEFELRRDMERMLVEGWEMSAQVGQFAQGYGGLKGKSKVTVTWIKKD